MDPDLVRAIARRGAQANQAKGTAHRWTSETAREAALKLGVLRRARAQSDPVAAWLDRPFCKRH